MFVFFSISFYKQLNFMLAVELSMKISFYNLGARLVLSGGLWKGPM